MAEAAGRSQLAEREARGQAIIDSAMDAIITVDDAQRIIQFNAAAETIFGRSRREVLGQGLDGLIPERFREAHRQHIARFGATGVTMRRMGAAGVLYGLRASGEEFPMDASISQVEVGGRKFFTVILRDVTERERAAQQLGRSNQELRELYAAMHEVREAERTRIARELHDELAQWLTALKMDVSWLKSRLEPEQRPLAAKTDKMRELVDSMVSAVRRIAADLRPPMLDDLGLTAAVENLAHEFSERAGVAVNLDLGTDGVEFHDPLATAVYRMIQEALTNVARHAKASDVEVSMRIEGDALRVRVRDNGRGIGAAGSDHKSFGVAGIRERARTLGGMAEIYSPAGRGTLVDISIPVAAGQRAGARA
jgi:PAS domain S-box-containing protein